MELSSSQQRVYSEYDDRNNATTAVVVDVAAVETKKDHSTDGKSASPDHQSVASRSEQRRLRNNAPRRDTTQLLDSPRCLSEEVVGNCSEGRNRRRRRFVLSCVTDDDCPSASSLQGTPRRQAVDSGHPLAPVAAATAVVNTSCSTNAQNGGGGVPSLQNSFLQGGAPSSSSQSTTLLLGNEKSALPPARGVGRPRRFDDGDGGDSPAGATSGAHRNAREQAALTGVFRYPPHPSLGALPTPTQQGSENWGMVRRFGFPCSQESVVCDAEHRAHHQYLEAAVMKCEKQWSVALKGVPLLANATDESTGPLRKLSLRCGIPGHLRGIVWLTLSGVALRLEENEKFCASLLHRFGLAPDPEAVDAIEKDVDRTFPNHPYYAAADAGQPKLRRVLHALCWRNPLLNYCQSFNFLAATLLLVTDDEDATFWLMVMLLENILPNDYYGEGLLGAKIDQEVVAGLVASELPHLAQHLDEIRFDVRALVPSWLLSLFVNVFPFDTVIRIWDVLCTHADLTARSNSGKHFGTTGGSSSRSSGGGSFGCGSASMRSAFPIAIMIGFLKLHESTLLALDDAGEVMQRISREASTCFDREQLVEAALSVPLSADKLHLLRRHHRVLVRQQEVAKATARRALQARRSGAQPAGGHPQSPLWRTDERFPSTVGLSTPSAEADRTEHHNPTHCHEDGDDGEHSDGEELQEVDW